MFLSIEFSCQNFLVVVIRTPLQPYINGHRYQSQGKRIRKQSHYCQSVQLSMYLVTCLIFIFVRISQNYSMLSLPNNLHCDKYEYTCILHCKSL
jgi:hypothetical protein